MTHIRLTALAVLAAAGALAQLTPEQRASEFLTLASIYSKYYAPYEWKQTLFQFDLLEARPWLDRIAQVKDDLDFYEICMEYVSKLNDTHVNITLPSNFSASLGFTVDIYDGKVLIDSITRSALSASRYPFQVGDELVSVDGKDVEQWMEEFSRYRSAGNPRSRRRSLAAMIVTRSQNRMPHAPDVGDTATVVVRRWGGEAETYSIPWRKSGLPFQTGPVPSPKAARRAAAAGESLLTRLQNSQAADLEGILDYGSRAPVFDLPEGFELRVGRSASDVLFSGIYRSGDYRIGLIRIPSYGGDTSTGLRQFTAEIQYMKENTDGLVIDQMRNPGGNLCYGQNIVARLVNEPFRPMLYEIRATWSWVMDFQAGLNAARTAHASQSVIDSWQRLLDAALEAYKANRGRTVPVPICGASDEIQPARDREGNPLVYTKPLLVLMDEFSTSTADSVPAMLQDAGRATLFGMRTNGAGGTNTTMDAMVYSEATAGLTLGMMTRKAPVVTPDYPTSSYVENIGVRPDIECDYMTRDNLVQNGKPFVAAFTKAIVEAIQKATPAS